MISESKYIDKQRVFFLLEYNEIVPWLQKSPNPNGKEVIICCSDGAAEYVIKNNCFLTDKYYTPSTSISISDLMEKNYQSNIANDCGISAPNSSVYYRNESIDWNEYPCIIKPFKSVMGAGKDDIRICYSKDELMHSISLVTSNRIQIQKYIKKDIEFQLIGCSLEAGRIIIIPGYTEILRQPENTNTGYLIYSPIDQLSFDRKKVDTFLETIGYSGLFSIEFIRGKDGKNYFLEINMRNDGNAYCVESAGVNLPFIWSYYQTYGKLPKVPMTFEKPVFFIPDFNDLKIAFRMIGPVKWVKQFLHAESHSIFNKKDMGPFKFEFIRQVKRVLKL